MTSYTLHLGKDDLRLLERLVCQHREALPPPESKQTYDDHTMFNMMREEADAILAKIVAQLMLD